MNIKESLEKFKKLPLEFALTIDGEKVTERMQKINKKYNIDISSLIIFVAVGDLELDKVASFLRIEFNLDISMARIIAEEISTNIFKPLRKRLDFLNANPKKNMPIIKEKNIILNIFRKRLVQEIKNNAIIINAVNYRIFYVLARDLNFKKEIEEVLYQNNEKIGTSPIIINGKENIPTIANWIKYFIKDNSSAMFDSIILSKFIANPKNTGNLSNNEKKLLANVLKTYRNIKFFPESMPNNDIDNMIGWEIIPIKKEEYFIKKSNTIKRKDIFYDKENKKIIKDKSVTKENKDINSREKDVHSSYLSKIKEDNLRKREREIAMYKKELEKYKKGSIEYKTIKQEIKRLY